MFPFHTCNTLTLSVHWIISNTAGASVCLGVLIMNSSAVVVFKAGAAQLHPPAQTVTVHQVSE